MTTSQFYKMVNHESGLLGISETSSDMRDLLDHEKSDVRAAEALLNGNVGPTAVAKRMGVSRATLYRHLKQADAAVQS